MKLCFGTFSSVLYLCGANRLTKNKLLNTIVQSVDSTCELSPSSVTWLMQCSSNLPIADRRNSKGCVASIAEKTDRFKVAEYFAKSIVSLIDNDKRKLVVLAIREIIKKDTSIDNDTIIELTSGTSKKALLEQSRINLPNFLSGIFLYTANVDNKTGKESVEFITSEWLQSLDGKSRKIAFVNPQNASSINADAEVLNTYLANAKGRYGSAKTLLFKDSPKPFYSFYVTNDIEHFVGRTKGNIIKNATAELLENVSNFLILEGDGGLGKSMMMCHLLLNAIDNSYQRIPILVSLKEYGNGGSLFNLLYSKIAVFEENITKTIFEYSLREGSFLLLLDGMDEIKSEYSQHFERDIEQFTDKYPKNTYVISSRPYQSFLSLSRFTIVRIKPFTQAQSLKLVDKLEFRPDEPIFKKSFMDLLRNKLYETHRSFVENPLLLTILMLTFEKFADIPTKMHIFYQNAFITLSETHDASKGGFKRVSKSGLSIEAIRGYFAEFCFHSYNDYKYEFTEAEFSRYFDIITTNNRTASAVDFAYDLCANLCLMYLDGAKYHFIHRSFQEYFCALFFSMQDDQLLKRLGNFFENRQRQMWSDNTLKMLYDMIPDKVVANIFIPFLQGLLDECNNANGYWTFLEKMYPCIRYEKGEVNDYYQNEPTSYLFSFIISLIKPTYLLHCEDLPGDDTLVHKNYGYVYEDDACRALVDIDLIPTDYTWVKNEPEAVGWSYEFDVEFILSRRGYEDIIKMLDNDGFIFKSEYLAAMSYLDKSKAKQLSKDEYLLSLLQR